MIGKPSDAAYQHAGLLSSVRLSVLHATKKHRKPKDHVPLGCTSPVATIWPHFPNNPCDSNKRT
jgi:hypothetical protein